VFEIVVDVACRNLLFGDVSLQVRWRSLGTVSTRSAPTTVFDPFLISAIPPRVAVFRERISQVFCLASIMPIHGGSMMRPFTR
jgi:hypothetical protein